MFSRRSQNRLHNRAWNRLFGGDLRAEPVTSHALSLELDPALGTVDAVLLAPLGWDPADKNAFRRIGRDVLLAAHEATYRFTQMKSGRSKNLPKPAKHYWCLNKLMVQNIYDLQLKANN